MACGSKAVRMENATSIHNNDLERARHYISHKPFDCHDIDEILRIPGVAEVPHLRTKHRFSDSVKQPEVGRDLPEGQEAGNVGNRKIQFFIVLVQ